MKKLIFTIGLVLSATFLYVSCEKNVVQLSKTYENIKEQKIAEQDKSMPTQTANAQIFQLELENIKQALEILMKDEAFILIAQEKLENAPEDRDNYFLLEEAMNENLAYFEGVIHNTMQNATRANQLIQSLHSTILANAGYKPMVYVPYYDEHHSLENPMFSKKVLKNEKLMGNEIGQQKQFEISEKLAFKRALILVTLYNTNGNPEFAGISAENNNLPWKRCYCTRNLTGGKGTCSRGRGQVHCNGVCGRANIWGDCPGGFCPPC